MEKVKRCETNVSEPDFTLGPWTLVDNSDNDGYGSLAITTAERIRCAMVDICSVETYYDEPLGTEQEANAHLIAAAPEMYELLDNLRDAMASVLGLSAEMEFAYAEAIGKMLARARGEGV